LSLIREWNDVYEKDLSKIISFLEAEIHNQPTLLILSGPVGAGKTTFSKKLISKLLKEDDNDLEVVSPTYSVINKIDEIVHADFYRIESEEELIHLELSLYLENCKLLIVEWGKDYYSSLKEEVGDDFKTLELVIDFEIKNDQQVTTSRTAKLFNLC
jgi:tRNA threonylcarbamoyladenosine biosynthesis protein TsaE